MRLCVFFLIFAKEPRRKIEPETFTKKFPFATTMAYPNVDHDKVFCYLNDTDNGVKNHSLVLELVHSETRILGVNLCEYERVVKSAPVL